MKVEEGLTRELSLAELLAALSLVTDLGMGQTAFAHEEARAFGGDDIALRSIGARVDREVGVLRLLARGDPNKRVAKRLGISPKTVGHHVQHIYDKVGVSTRAAAAVFAMESGLLH